METETLASEMLHELQNNNKRLFISLLVVLFLWFSTIIGFVWYESQYEYTDSTSEINTTDIATDNGENADVDISGIDNG